MSFVTEPPPLFVSKFSLEILFKKEVFPVPTLPISTQWGVYV